MEEAGDPKERSVAAQAFSPQQDTQPRFTGWPAAVAEKGGSETADSSQELSSAHDAEADEHCGDAESAWLDRMLAQLGLPHCRERGAGVGAGPVADPAWGGSEQAAAGRQLDELMSEEHYHREFRDVLRTIMSIKVHDTEAAVAELRAAWKRHVRNAKIMDALNREKQRTLGLLKEQLLQLKLENQLLREKTCAAPPPL